jgi:hypothetical protein
MGKDLIQLKFVCVLLSFGYNYNHVSTGDVLYMASSLVNIMIECRIRLSTLDKA